MIIGEGEKEKAEEEDDDDDDDNEEEVGNARDAEAEEEDEARARLARVPWGALVALVALAARRRPWVLELAVRAVAVSVSALRLGG